VPLHGSMGACMGTPSAAEPLFTKGNEASPLLASHPRACGCSTREGELLLMSLIVMIASISKMFVDQALYTCEEQIVDTTGVSSVLSSLPAVGTAMYALGKLTGIPLSARIGAFRGLVMATLVSGVASLVFTIGSPTAMYVSWLAHRFVSAFVWPSSVIAFVAWFDARLFGRASFLLSIAWDGGTALAGGVYAAVLQSPQPDAWRLCFYTASGLCLLSFLLTVFFFRDSPAALGLRLPEKSSPGLTSAAHPLDRLTGAEAVRALLSDWVFWLAIAARSFGAAFTYLMTYAAAFVVDGLGGSGSIGALIAAMSAVGLIVGSLLGGVVFDRLPTATMRTAFMCISIVGFTVVGLLILLYSAGVRTILWFTLVLCGGAFFLAIPLNVTQLVYSYKYAGAVHVGSAVHIIDSVALAVAAGAQAIGGKWVSNEEFVSYTVGIAVFIVLTGGFTLAFLIADLNFRTPRADSLA